MANKSSKLIGFLRKKNRSTVRKILITKGGRTTIDESYNRLKDNILYSGAKGIKVIQVEASIPSEGKTTMICNLGVSLAFHGKKVVIIDLDFRKPQVGSVFSLPDEKGIGDYMVGECSKDEIIKTTEYGVGVITRGKDIPNSSIVLDSDKMSAFIAELKEEYDFVLLDCPPVLLVSDYMHIARYSDGILFTVSSSFVKKSVVKDSVKLLKKLETPIIGAVMTFVSSDDVYYGYGDGESYIG